MKPTVYVETSIPSYHHTRRTGRRIETFAAVTREWWRGAGRTYQLVTSLAVVAELQAGTVADLRGKRLRMIRDLPRLRVTERVIGVAEVCVTEKVMPSDLQGDALHLAIASVHECDYLVSWNFKHFVNENKRPHVEAVNRRLGLPSPRLVSPLELPTDP